MTVLYIFLTYAGQFVLYFYCQHSTSTYIMSKRKQYYVYKLTNNHSDKFYYGYRSCGKNIDPNDDLGVKYFSSGSFKESYKTTPTDFTKEIIAVFENKDDAYYFEQVTIKSHIQDPYCVNKWFDERGLREKTAPRNIKPIPIDPEFQQSIKHLSPAKRRKAIRKEKKRLSGAAKKTRVWNKTKKYLVQYCDLETKAVVYIIP